MQITEEIRNELLTAQRNEITEYHVYKNIARTLPKEENRRIVEKIGEDEKRHYEVWKSYTGKEVPPNRLKIWFYTAISRLFGFTFGFKLMELGEEKAQINYEKIAEHIPEARPIIHDENTHENILLSMLDEKALIYAGSVVLGLNDALVELTGALAGLTFAFRDVKLIALSGLITGIAASLSMATSEYLSTRAEKTEKDPVRAAVVTGIAYLATVALLILPFLILQNEIISLVISLITSVLIIAVFNFYISVARDLPFGKHFLEMAGLSLGVAAISFLFGILVRNWFGIEI